MSSVPARIKRVDIADPSVREAVHSMIAECFKPDEWQGARLPQPQTGYWWVAFDDAGQPVAFASLRPSARFDQVGYLSISGVLPAARGKGLQKKLIRKRVQHARKLGWHTVVTETMHSNAASMRSLIACGFRPYNPTVPWGDLEHAVYWKRATEASPT